MKIPIWASFWSRTLYIPDVRFSEAHLHVDVIFAGIGFGSQPGSSFTPGSSSAHTVRHFQGEGTVGRQDSSSGGAVNAGSVQAAASTMGDGRRGRNRSRWDRNRDQISIIQEMPVELSGFDNSNPTHQPEGFV